MKGVESEGLTSPGLGRVTLAFVLAASLGLFLSWLAYPAYYSPVTSEVSELGSTTGNPHGYYFFSAGFLTSGAALVALGTRLKRLVVPASAFWGKLGVGAFLAGSVGWGLVGAFPSDVNRPLHLTAAGAAFVGTFASLLALALPLSKVASKRWLLALAYAPVLAASVATIARVVVPIAFDPAFRFESPPPAWPACEWSAFASAIWWIVGSTLACSKR